MPLSRHSSVLHRLANPFGKIFRYTLRFRSCGFSRGAGCCLVPLRCNAGIWEKKKKKKTVGAWLCGYVEHKQTFILVKIDYCGYDLKPVTLHHQNNYKKVSL